jgi:hypothetical protein
VDVLHHADLVVGEHHRDEKRLGPQRSFQCMQPNAARNPAAGNALSGLRLDCQSRHRHALPFQMIDRIEHGIMLGRHGDDVAAAVSSFRKILPAAR